MKKIHGSRSLQKLMFAQEHVSLSDKQEVMIRTLFVLTPLSVIQKTNLLSIVPSSFVSKVVCLFRLWCADCCCASPIRASFQDLRLQNSLLPCLLGVVAASL